MRVVIDTNVLVSYLFWPESKVRRVLDSMLFHAEILRSTETFAELSKVVMRRKFDTYLSLIERELFLASFYDTSKHVLITERIKACRDLDDDKILGLAVSGKADMVLTGDSDLLALHPFRSIPILNPAAISSAI